jgi:hypothetical protein
MKRILVIVVLALTMTCPALLGQVVKGSLAGSQTPLSVLDGTAGLVGHYSSTRMLRLVFGLQPPHMAEEEQFLKDLHTKGSPEFQHFLTAEEWNARFAPSARDERAVVDWAQSQGLTVTHRYPNRLLVDIEGTVSTIERTLNVTINNYQLGTRSFFSNDRDPAIPAELSGIVQSVQGLNNLQRMHPAYRMLAEPTSLDYVPGPVVAAGPSSHGDADRKQLPAGLKGSRQGTNVPNITSGSYDPSDIYSSEAYDFNALYNQGHCCNPFGNPSGSPPETSIAIAAFGDLDYNDIGGFHNQYPYLAYNVQKIYIDGQPPCGGASQPNCLEVTMDTEYSLAMANSFGSYLDTAKIWVYEGGNFNNSTFTDMYNQMVTDGHARVFSTSWSCTEFYGCDSGTMDSRHNIFNQMVGQGWTLVAASGDRGSADDCNFNNPAHEGVAFPGSDPDVISAGGTLLSLFGDSTYSSEVAWSGGTATLSCARNHGGSGGGVSAYYAAPSYQTNLVGGSTNRSVPDISLNAAAGQNIYFGGSLFGSGGTSIVAPELAGFFAQENAYLLTLGSICGGSGTSTCAPMGNANYYIYQEGINAPYAQHYPFYDITSGCNSNDVTAADNLGYFCAGTGWDNVTGWGSANMLQLAWAINTYLAFDGGRPTVTFSGPATSHWYNADQTVSWTVADTTAGTYPANGVAGFSQAWDADPGDVYSEATPGSGNSFYSGPQFANATAGWLNLAGAGSQGCHSANVYAWDNAGLGSFDQAYGPLCYDTIPPTTTAFLSPLANGFGWEHSNTQVILSATDPGAGSTGSGVAATYYLVDANFCFIFCPVYSGPISITSEGKHTVHVWSKDVAGNFESSHNIAVNVDKTTPHTAAVLSGTLSVGVYLSSVKVTLIATDNLSGVLSTVYQIDGGTVFNYVFPFIVSAAGPHTVTFHSLDYAGNVESTESASFKIDGTTSTSIASSANPSTYGATVIFTVTVSSTAGIPTGTVIFKNGSSTLGTRTLSGGMATFATSTLALGNHSITAVYAGSSNFLGSTSSVLMQTVKAKSTTSVTSSLNPSKHGTSVTFTATVTSTAGTPAGTVTFKNGGSTVGGGTINTTTHQAKFATSTLPIGTHSITAAYAGNAEFNGSTSAVLHQVVN